MYRQKLIEKFSNKTAVIGIYGLGYVGLPLMLRFIEAGFKVVGFDVDEKKVVRLNSGQSYIKHIPGPEIQNAITHGFEVGRLKRGSTAQLS